jgi:hypothetical protein
VQAGRAGRPYRRPAGAPGVMGQARPIWLRNVALSQNRYSSVMRPSFQRAAVENRMSNERPVGWMLVPSGSFHGWVKVPVNRVTKQLAVARLIDELHGPKKLAARLVRFDGAYVRFTGELRIEHRHADAVVDSYTDPAIWELMYLGKTGTRQ